MCSKEKDNQNEDSDKLSVIALNSPLPPLLPFPF